MFDQADDSVILLFCFRSRQSKLVKSNVLDVYRISWAFWLDWNGVRVPCRPKSRNPEYLTVNVNHASQSINIAGARTTAHLNKNLNLTVNPASTK
jgi:hypothetical protein